MGAGLYIHTYIAQADFIAEILLLQSAAVTAAITGMYQYARTEGTVLTVLENQILVAVVPLCILLFIGERIWKCMAGENQDHISVQQNPS